MITYCRMKVDIISFEVETKNSNNYSFSRFTKAQRHQILRKIIEIHFSKPVFQFLSMLSNLESEIDNS